jgi:hypothetical protein
MALNRAASEISPWILGPLPIAALLLAMVGMIGLGRLLRARHTRHHVERQGLEPLEAGVLGLMGLLLAFTLTGAAARFDARRALIAEEANAIGTAYLRLGQEVEPARAALQARFRRYVDERLAMYRAIPDMAQVRLHFERGAELQAEIWRDATAAASQSPRPMVELVVLPALNNMIDITTTRAAATAMHPPRIVFVLLTSLALLCALFAGYRAGFGGTHSWVHLLGFAAALALTLYATIEIEFPRLGLVRESGFDRLLMDVRNHMR